MHYVVGFAFDMDLEKVVLIEKKRPAKHKGLLNGVGGSVEKGETSQEAMRREYEEETGVKADYWWNRFLTMSTANDERIDFFFVRSDELVVDAKTTTDESIYVLSLETELPTAPTVANVKWLIEMALSIAKGQENVQSFQVIEQWR